MRKHSIPHVARARFVLALALAAALLFSLSAATAASAAHKHHRGHKSSKGHHKKKGKRARKASVPMTGIYDACDVSNPVPTPLPNCADRLAVLHQGGFQVVLNYWTDSMSVADNLKYADEAQSQGMKVIWNLGNFRAPLAPKLDLVRATMNHPATWGYYIGDEVDPANRGVVAELSGAVRSLTNRPLLYVSRPNPSKLRAFKGLADYIGPDDYPVGPIDPPVCQTARMASKIVKTNMTMVLQAYSWSIDFSSVSPDWPSATQMRQMRNQAMRCGRPKLLMWFCFHCITNYNPNPDSYWRDLAWAANDVNLNPTYRMTSMGTPTSSAG
jgi:hypothetical protein